MSFPTFPATLTWNTPYRDRERISMARYQAGVEQVERVGINRRSQSIDVNIRIQNAGEVAAFLKERRGRPFKLQTDSRLLGEELLFSCDEWEMPEIGKKLWEFRATFNQERRFEPKIAQYLSLTAETLNVSAGQTIALTAGLSGFSSMPVLSWSIVSGPGTVTPGLDNLATYSAALNSSSGTAIVRVRVLGTDLEATGSLTISANPGITSVVINPATVDRDATNINPTVLTAVLNISGGAANAVVWSVRSGTAVLDASTGLRTNVLIPNLDQTVVIRATAIADSSKWAESIITVRKPALISGISVSSSPPSILVGGVAQLSATVLGVGPFNPSVTWAIVSGGGTLSGQQYTAGQTVGSVVLEAVSIANPLVRQQLTIAIVSAMTSTITSVTASASPNPVYNGYTTQLSATVVGIGNFDPAVTWIVVSGLGTITGNILTANGVGTIVVKATSVQDPTKNDSISVSAVAVVVDEVTGITGTATPSTIYIGQTSSINVVVTGTGAYSTDTSWFTPNLNVTGTGNSRVFTAQSFANTSSMRISSVERPDIFVDVAVQVLYPTITSITVSALPNPVSSGSTTQLSVVVEGVGPFDPSVVWSVVSGPGTIVGSVLTANGVGTIVVTGTSVHDPSMSDSVSISSIASATVTTDYVVKSFGSFRIYDGMTEGLQNGITTILAVSNQDLRTEGFVALLPSSFGAGSNVWGLWFKTELEEYWLIYDIDEDLQLYNWSDVGLTESEYLTGKSSPSATILS